MENGVLTMETAFSDKDFLIEWDKVQKLQTNTVFIISLTNKFRINGTISFDELQPDYLVILGEEGSRYLAKLLDIVYLKSTENRVIDRFSANIDGGYNITKASSTKQFSLSGKAKYLYTQISAEVYVNFIDNITQDTIKARRNNYGTSWRIFFGKNLFALGTTDFLESDEQNLDLRTTIQVGLGKFLLRDHRFFLMSALGIASNSEKFLTTGVEPENTYEAFAETEFSVYGLKDLRINSKIQYFPSLSRVNRNRFIFTLDTKLDLPLDFYVGLYYTFNFDSKPSESATKTDYVFQSAVGWKF